MAERIDYTINVVANIERVVPADGDETAAEAAVDTLGFLEQRCIDLDAEPRLVASLAVLDLCAALVAFGGVRNAEEIHAWLRQELPARVKDLNRVGDSFVRFNDLPPCTCLQTPVAATWH
jgi:hypothetical protein